MQRNDYRRALIMLRSLLNGYSGHARIEIRTLLGSLSIRATIPQSAQSVRAALVGRRRSGYFAHALGDLRRDMRGQAGLTVSIDPRNIGGRPLEDYSLLAIVTINDGVCQLALVGNLNGSCEQDWGAVHDAVCALYAPQPRSADPAQDEPSQAAFEAPAAEEMTMQPEAEPEQAPSADENSDEGLIWDFTPDEPEQAEEPAPGDAQSGEIPLPFAREGWSFARVALPEACGFTYAYVGAPACGGEICCALPGMFSPEPPPGLDGYEWIGENGSGYWVRCYDPQEGVEQTSASSI